jgi:hypothetical protein
VEASAAESDLATGIALLDKPEGVRPEALNRWRERAAGRLKLEAALGELSKSVERQMAAP